MKKVFFILGLIILTFNSCNKSIRIDSINTKGVVVKEYSKLDENGNIHYIVGIKSQSDVVETEVSYSVFYLINQNDSIK